MPDTMDDVDNLAALRALQIAFQTMQERCHQLENRLAAVEEENIRLKIGKSSDDCTDIVVGQKENDEPPTISLLQEKIEELVKQKSQLTHHVLMVAAENRQLWNRLTRLTRANKNLGSKLIKISDTLKQNSNTHVVDIKDHNEDNSGTNNPGIISNDNIILQSESKDTSLEEISLRLINSIMMEKSELEQQYSEMVKLQSGTDVDLKTIGFAYPDDNSIDTLQQLKQHEARLCQTKNSMLSQQEKLQKVLKSLKKIKNSSKKVCQTGTQFDSDDSLREHESTQTSLPLSSTSPESTKHEQPMTNNNNTDSTRTCPICGVFYGKSLGFQSFHEHVCSHFALDTAEFELLP
ncbi:hypothetical protein PV326_014123 [Microctonus aethiopoides]|uniref:UBZ1-type domain-containing protein n=1 Tax=Microctonus aethiopoides TaxID=144406 RepID=A0AA39FPB8_9HYME|nr:hypothetical protein PV326_014123 [Microctonus aethiopoides]KAK0173325.1 hypothetical protein PV328_006540 [Microctonus aethiopoides]